MISKEILGSLRNQFIKYTSQFNSNDFFVQQHFNVKQKHTFRVCDNIVEIGKKIGLNEEQLLIAELVALFHDIGRFEQYNQYKTFSDLESVNHSELGIHVIKENNFLNNLSHEIKNLVFNTILSHNLPRITSDAGEITIMYSMLLRDADKLDIYKVVMDYDLQESKIQANKEKDYKIPDNILNCFTRRQIVDISLAQTKFDFFLFRVSWIFDINFQPTFHILDQRNYLKYFLDCIPKSYRLMNIQNIVREYMVEKIFSYA